MVSLSVLQQQQQQQHLSGHTTPRGDKHRLPHNDNPLQITSTASMSKASTDGFAPDQPAPLHRQTPAHAHTHTRASTHTHTRTHTCTLARTHAHTKKPHNHTQNHTNTYTHKHTHKHTHITHLPWTDKSIMVTKNNPKCPPLMRAEQGRLRPC